MRAQAQQATITHAVIGTQETINFGISNDPAFFQILSSSLYKNPVLAVVRETMCNAHDAHIMANVKKPIRIDIDHENLFISFRDYGPGIHHDLISQIYGVYGASTKKTDSRQTGAFGLGCKSPFAYVEHFEVTSWHQGVKSIYNMSRSSAAKDGTPGITRLLSIPSTEKGLQVRFKLNAEDVNRFVAYIHRIAYLGGIPTKLGDQELPMMYLSQTPGHWTIVSQNMLDDVHRRNELYVRYGAVVYPLEPHPEYKPAYQIINHFVNANTSNQSIVIQAVPDSLVVMPNRESLSMQDQTVSALKLLCEEFVRKNLTGAWRHELLEAGKFILNNKDNTLAKLLTYGRLLGKERGYYDDSKATVKLGSPQTDPLEALAQYNVMRWFRENHLNIAKPLTLHRMRILEKHSELDRGLIQSYFKARLQAGKRGYVARRSFHYAYDKQKEAIHDWYMHRIIKPVAAKLHAAGYSTKTNLLMYGKVPGDYTRTSGRRYHRTSIGFGSVHRTLNLTLEESSLMIPCLKRVVLTTSQRLLQQNESTIFNTFLPHMDPMGLLAYVLPTKKNQQEEIRKIFTNLGYMIIDLSVDSDWKETDTKPTLATPKPKKPIIEGRRTLLSYYDGQQLKKSKPELDIKDRLTQPEFYALLIRDRFDANNPATIDKLGSPKFSLVKDIAANGVGLETANSVPVLMNQGVPSLAEYIMTNLHNHMLSSQTLRTSLEYDLVTYAEKTKGVDPSIYNLVLRIPELRDHFKLQETLTDDDKLALRWWRYLNSLHQYRYHGIKSMDAQVTFVDGKQYTYMQEIEAYLQSIPLAAQVPLAFEDISQNKLLCFLDIPHIHERLVSVTDPLDPKNKQHLIDMLMAAVTV
jgi:hypothetical protein